MSTSTEYPMDGTYEATVPTSPGSYSPVSGLTKASLTYPSAQNEASISQKATARHTRVTGREIRATWR